MKFSPASLNKMEAGSQRSAEKKGRGKSKNYSRFIYKVLKQGPQEQSVCLSKESDLIFTIASEAARLSLYNKRRTITRREVESAVQNITTSGRSTHSAATE
ncbi:histone H2B type 3-B-like [Hyla sarda]|uniref:histone H2B type 3-B-like n=1 Tax=Hyla sarda TaxID=327740 RepID=UPI0024C41A33|nr:histone H2B type 3-B-like [Hyla sarda]XP_056391373.1 histone H2B type 3-B-like [Hyla sarda]XP_056391375.1 histone H2B type 3-B-like [Hyla sarda]